MERRQAEIFLFAEAGGGVSRHVIDLYFGLSRRGWKARLIVSPTRLEQMHAGELQDVPPGDVAYVPMRRNPGFSDLRAVASMIGLVSRRPNNANEPRNPNEPHSYRILHAHSTKAGLLGALLKPWVDYTMFTPHAFRSMDPALSRTSATLIRGVEAVFTRAYDRVVAVAPAEYESAMRLGIPPTRLRHIPNGIHTEAYQPPFRPVYRPLHATDFTVGFVGRLVRQKNTELFLRTLRLLVDRYPHARAVVAGDGDLASSLRSLARSLKLSDRIEWLGTVPARSVFPRLHLLFHTSTYEGMPYTLIEAAAAQVPMVATGNPGTAAVLQAHAPEALVSSFEAEALLERATALLASEGSFRQHLAHLQDVAGAFSTDTMVTAIEAEYLALLNSGTHRLFSYRGSYRGVRAVRSPIDAESASGPGR